jgi:hypothetical protein
MLDLTRVGMRDDDLTIMHQLIRKPNGILINTGPTGSGKTTTLYAALNELNRTGFDGETLKLLDIWESPEAFGAFAESRLGPGIAETLGDDAPDGPPQPTFTELHNAYSV